MEKRWLLLKKTETLQILKNMVIYFRILKKTPPHNKFENLAEILH